MILIHPYSRPLNNGKENPKNYPFWSELLMHIDEPVIQIGKEGETPLVENFQANLPIEQIKALIKECRTWIAVDSFFQHLCWSEGKPGIVLWSVSNPDIFGHPENVNLLKDKSCLAPNQFLWWETVEYDENKFVRPEAVLPYLKAN